MLHYGKSKGIDDNGDSLSSDDYRFKLSLLENFTWRQLFYSDIAELTKWQCLSSHAVSSCFPNFVFTVVPSTSFDIRPSSLSLDFASVVRNRPMLRKEALLRLARVHCCMCREVLRTVYISFGYRR
jgi:hypothetical protein